jgi:multiple sugar transport system permease protein/raffinose/stachyose/melibiose transport system permease protein
LVTFEFAIASQILLGVGSFFLALALEKNTRLNRFFRALFYCTLLIGQVSIAFIFKNLLRSSGGTINEVLSFILPGEVSINWLGSVNFTIFVLAIVHSIHFIGPYIIVYNAGLSSVPEELIDAAKVEGAGFWQIVKNVKIPLIMFSITYNMTVAIIGSLQSFAIIFAITKGGPAKATSVLNLFIFYRFADGHFALATTGSLILLVLNLFLAVILINLFRRREVQL